MFELLQSGTLLFQYLSPQQKVLASDGQFLLQDASRHTNEEPTDYSYVVFPFAKMYEGFLKQLFLDLNMISSDNYQSVHFRIGRALSPNLVRRLGERSVFKSLRDRYGADLANTLWNTWKDGRNLVFHYFPHNYRSLSLEQARELVGLLVDTMDMAVRITHPTRTSEAT